MTEAGACLASVVVYSEGDETLLGTTLTSLGRQTISGFEVVLSGGFPNADAALAVMELAARLGLRARPVSTDLAMSAARRNYAVETTRGIYALELAAGDELHPTMLEKCIWALETRPRAAVAMTGGPSQADEQMGATRANPEDGVLSVAGQVSVFRKRAWYESGRFDERAPADVVDRDFCLKLVNRGWAVITISEELVRRRQRPRGEDDTSAVAGGLPWLRAHHGAFWVRVGLLSRIGRFWSAAASRPSVLRALGRRVRSKLEQDDLTDLRRALRHPVNTMLRLLPGRFKGARWAQWGLPTRVTMWNEVPVLTETPTALRTVQMGSGPGTNDERTRVLVMHPYLIAGGAETVLLNLFTYVDPSRFDMHLITTESIPSARTQNPWMPRFAAQTRSIYSLPSFLERQDFLRFIIDFIKSRRIDVLLISLVPFGYHALPQIRLHCPDVAVVDLLHAEAPYIPIDSLRLASTYRELLDRRVVITESLRSVQITKYGELSDRVVVIPNAIDTATAFNPERRVAGTLRSEVGLDDATSIVLFFGRFAMEKQPLHVVEVADRLRSRSDIAFVLLGDGPETARLEAEVLRRGLRNVFVRPARDEVAEALADAKVVLFPSKREGLPMAGIESLAMGIPIVAANVPGWLELIDNGRDGILVEDGDFGGYARAVTELVDDPALYSRMSSTARRTALTRFSVIDNVHAWERLFLSLCAGGEA